MYMQYMCVYYCDKNSDVEPAAQPQDLLQLVGGICQYVIRYDIKYFIIGVVSIYMQYT
jgi:hypothetical protein